MLTRIFNLKQRSKFIKDTSGATLVYVTLIMTILIGAVGLAVDFSRLYLTHSQLQSAADAAAIAAASQLDGSSQAIPRANVAANGAAALVINSQQFGEETDQPDAGVSVTLRFLKSLPADDSLPITASDVTTDSKLAQYVEATTENVTHRNLFLPAIGISGNRNVQATAVAGQRGSICRLTMFAICNPVETDGGNEPFEIGDYTGKQILVKKHGNGSAWAPGNFGLLDPPTGGQGAENVSHHIALKDSRSQCYSTLLDTKPGQTNGARQAINTRFDIYENPMFKGEDGNDDYPPALNVTKGWTDTTGSKVCKDQSAAAASSTLMGLPRDNIFSDIGGADEGRFGNGKWDCADYWAANHPDDPGMNGIASAGFTCANDSAAMSRYDMYQYEINAGKIPGVATGQTNEEGSPQCYSGTSYSQTDPDTNLLDPEKDRRLIPFAVMNCKASGVQGNSSNIPGIAFVSGFITEPVVGSDFDVYLEIVNQYQTGDDDGPLKEYVEIYR